jgi:Tetratricopeptide repeat
VSWRTLVPVSLGGCPAGWELSRAFLEDGRRRDLTAHLGGCRRCAAEWRSLARARAAVRALPRPSMSEETFDFIETRLRLGLAAPGAVTSARTEARTWPKRTAAIFLTCGIAVGVALVWARVGGPGKGASPAGPSSSASWASIRAVGNTAFTRAPLPEEVVRLESGTLELVVGPAPPGRRFRVLTDDAVVESAESRLSVEAEGHMLVAVRVFAGYAEVRARGGHALLRAGDEWVHEGTHADAESAGIVPSPPSARAEHAARPASFERAWRLLNEGKAAEAAEAFRDVEAKSRGDAIVEDALFWRGVSLERADRSADARAVFLQFTARFPHSERIGEASAMLGWILLEAGDTNEARRAFERAANDKVDRVRASARSGLARLGR